MAVRKSSGSLAMVSNTVRFNFFPQQLVLRGTGFPQTATDGVLLRIGRVDITARRTPVFCNDPVFGGIDRDPVQPGVKSAVTTKTFDRPDRPL